MADASNVILTTSYVVANAEIEREVDILTAECAYGMNIFRDMFAGVRDIFGGRSGSVQKLLNEAKETVLEELRDQAASAGADAGRWRFSASLPGIAGFRRAHTAGRRKEPGAVSDTWRIFG